MPRRRGAAKARRADAYGHRPERAFGPATAVPCRPTGLRDVMKASRISFWPTGRFRRFRPMPERDRFHACRKLRAFTTEPPCRRFSRPARAISAVATGVMAHRLRYPAGPSMPSTSSSGAEDCWPAGRRTSCMFARENTTAYQCRIRSGLSGSPAARPAAGGFSVSGDVKDGLGAVGS